MHHADCVRDNGSCTVLGCRRTFDGKIAEPRPVRQLPVRTPPRDDFWIGLKFFAVGASGVALSFVLVAAFSGNPPGIAVVPMYTAYVIPIGMLIMGYALYRRFSEGRWRD